MNVETKITPLLKEVVEIIASECFVDGYEATTEECLGLAVSKYLEWNGVEIMEVASEALEDANFHREAELMRLLIS